MFVRLHFVSRDLKGYNHFSCQSGRKEGRAGIYLYKLLEISVFFYLSR